MPWVCYVRFEQAKKWVDAVNNAKTETDHRLAKAFLNGYKHRCEQEGLVWPCIDLDLSLPEDGRPACCGEYIDWEPTASIDEEQNQ